MKTLAGFLIVALIAGLLPFGLIALARSQPSVLPPVHPIQDMWKQQKFRPQRGNPMFADGRAMRPRVPGTVARDDLQFPGEAVNDPDRPRMLRLSNDSGQPYAIDFLGGPGQGPAVEEAEYRALTEGREIRDGKPAYITRFPSRMKVSADLLERGRERYAIYCAVCHGQGGYGDGPVALRAAEMRDANLEVPGWVAPKNYHSDDMREQPVGQLYNTIANGVRSMPAYGKQISVPDRWAIVAYVKALQRSQHAKPEDFAETTPAHEVPEGK